MRTGWNGPPAFRWECSTAPPAITLRPRNRTTSAGATYVFSPTTLNELRVSFFRPRNDFFVPSQNQNWGATLGIPNISPALMPSFSPTALGVGTYTVAPDYAQLYGLTVQGATRQIRQSESLRDDFSKIHGAHAFKMGYEILHFTDNFYQQGYPSGQFNFANTTAGLQPNGQPVPNTGNTFAGFELGSVSAANFTHLYEHLAAARIDQQPVFPGRLEVFQEPDFQPGPALVDRKPVSHRARAGEPVQPHHGRSADRNDGRRDPPDRRFEQPGSARTSSLASAWRTIPCEKWVFRGGFGLNTVDIRWPNQAMQFDEYQAQVVQQRAVQRSAAAVSTEPGPGAGGVQHSAQRHGRLRGHELRLAKRHLAGPDAASRLRR